MKRPIIGQEAICPDGLGRVEAFKGNSKSGWIKVKTYLKNRGCEWAWHNVRLIDPMGCRCFEPSEKFSGHDVRQD
jgi:hypothetical protein